MKLYLNFNVFLISLRKWILVLILLFVYSSKINAETAIVLRDPTQPPTSLTSEQVLQVEPLSLNAVIISPQRRVAVINGKVLQVGDQLYNNKILAIDTKGVQLDGVNGKISLFLISNPVKQPVIDN